MTLKAFYIFAVLLGTPFAFAGWQFSDLKKDEPIEAARKKHNAMRSAYNQAYIAYVIQVDVLHKFKGSDSLEDMGKISIDYGEWKEETTLEALKMAMKANPDLVEEADGDNEALVEALSQTMGYYETMTQEYEDRLAFYEEKLRPRLRIGELEGQFENASGTKIRIIDRFTDQLEFKDSNGQTVSVDLRNQGIGERNARYKNCLISIKTRGPSLRMSIKDNFTQKCELSQATQEELSGMYLAVIEEEALEEENTPKRRFPLLERFRSSHR